MDEFEKLLDELVNLHEEIGEGADPMVQVAAACVRADILDAYRRATESREPSGSVNDSRKIIAAEMRFACKNNTGPMTIHAAALRDWAKRIEATERREGPTAGEAWLPDDGAYLIRYDDAEVPDEFFAMSGAREAAMRRYKARSGSWNAHLFVKIDSNSRDESTPNASAPAQGEWVRCYAVPTDDEKFTLHDEPPPLCDYEVIMRRPAAAPSPPSGVMDELTSEAEKLGLYGKKP